MVRRVVIIATIYLFSNLVFDLFPENIAWDFETTYTINNDGNYYYLDSSKTLTSDLYIDGFLEIYSNGILNTDDKTVYNNNTLIVSDGTFNLEYGGLFSNGYTTSGVINIIGGTFNQVGGNFQNGAHATLPGSLISISGGTYSISDGIFYNGYSEGASGQINIAGGMFNVTGGDFYNSWSSTGTVLVSGGICNFSGGSFYNGKLVPGFLEITGGIINFAYVTLKNGYQSDGTIILDGGILMCADNGIIVNGDGGGCTGNFVLSTGDFIFDGGSVTKGLGTSNITVFAANIFEDIVDGSVSVSSDQAMVIAADDTFDFGPDCLLTNSGLITNYGSLLCSGTFVNNGTFNNNGYFSNDGDFSIGTFSNTSTFYDTWHPEVMYTIPLDDIYNRLYYVDTNITLTTDLQISGTLDLLSGGYVDLCDFTVSNSNNLRVLGGQFFCHNAGKIYNDKLIILDQGIFSANGASLYNGLTATATVKILDGTFYFSAGSKVYNGYLMPGEVDVSGGTLLFYSGNFYNGCDVIGTVTVDGGTFLNLYSTLDNGYTSTGILNISSGAFYNAGGVVNSSDELGEIGLYGGVLQNGGQINGTIDERGGILIEV